MRRLAAVAVLAALVVPVPASAVPGDGIDYQAANTSHQDCIRVLDQLAPDYVDAVILARDLDVQLGLARDTIERQASTIERLRARLADRKRR